MSLLCGIYERRDAPAGVLHDMLAALPGRGGTEQWRRGAVALATRELQCHTQAPTQPSSPHMALAADVRIDNRAEVCDALGLAAAMRASVSDRELVLRAYGRWGSQCPEHLVGDFAFAIWDSAARRLFCARDAVGARPFYYSLLPDRFVFASDVAAVLAAPDVPSDLDDSYVAAFLLRRYPRGSHTFFRAVRTLPPGHSLTVNADADHVERWWCPEDAPAVPSGSDSDYAAAFLDHCQRAVRDRLRGARVPGVHVSGGLDSSSVALFAARQRRPENTCLHAFSWHPPPGDVGAAAPQDALAAFMADEYARIEAVCAQAGLRPIYHSPTVAHIITMLKHDGARMSNRDGSLVPELLVQQSAATRGVDVLLTGWGGDECASFNGRGYYAGKLRAGHLLSLVRAAYEETEHPWRHLMMHAVLPQLHADAPRIARQLSRGRVPHRRKTFVHPTFASRARQLDRLPRILGVRPTQLELLRHGHLECRIEDWAASGARHGVEYRYPLLDRRLVEFALGLPSEQFRRGRWNRWLMRNALTDLLPPAVCWNPSKRVPAGADPGRTAFAEALLAVRRCLADRCDPPPRARYLDMPRVLSHLEADATLGIPQPGKLHAALQILDW